MDVVQGRLRVSDHMAMQEGGVHLNQYFKVQKLVNSNNTYIRIQLIVGVCLSFEVDSKYDIRIRNFHSERKSEGC